MSVNVDKLLKVAQRIATRHAAFLLKRGKARRGNRGPEKDDLLQQAALEALDLYSKGCLKPFARNLRSRIEAYVLNCSKEPDHENIDDYEVSDHRPFVDPADRAEMNEALKAVERLPEARRIAVRAMMYGRRQTDLAENRGVARQAINQNLKAGLRTLREVLFGAA